MKWLADENRYERSNVKYWRFDWHVIYLLIITLHNKKKEFLRDVFIDLSEVIFVTNIIIIIIATISIIVNSVLTSSKPHFLLLIANIFGLHFKNTFCIISTSYESF